jgi:hypothetical protein
VAEIVGALLVFCRLRPVQEVRFLALGLLREEVVGDAHRELIVLGELLDDGIVFRVVLKAAPCVNGAGHPEAVELAHEMAGRVELIVER